MGRKAITTEEFVRRSKEIHKDKYDYSKTIYVSREHKMIITCPTHGDFECWPCAHLCGSGCRGCSNALSRKGNEKFIEKSRELFGDRFTYEKLDYVNAHTDVILNCNIHGEFKARARKHLSSPTGCIKCSHIAKRTTTDEFISKAFAVHGNKYDYGAVEYYKVDVAVRILCNRCQKYFNQTPNGHLNGSGCSFCAKTGFNKGSPISYFYMIPVSGQEIFTGFGISSNLKHRLKTHNKNIGYSNCEISGRILLIESTGENISNLEQYVKSTLACSQVRVSGFKTESLRSHSCEELLKICVDWLTKEGIQYELLTQTIGVQNDQSECYTSEKVDTKASLCRIQGDSQNPRFSTQGKCV